MSELRWREVLEVGPDAGLDEITHAYHRLKRIHGAGDAGYALAFMDEFSPEARSRVMAELEEAYQGLTGLQAVPRPVPQTGPRPSLELIRPLDGAALRRAREAAGLSLEAVASETHVRCEFLAALEAEHFRELPAGAVYVRGYLTSFLRCLGVDCEPAISEYMARHQKAMR